MVLASDLPMKVHIRDYCQPVENDELFVKEHAAEGTKRLAQENELLAAENALLLEKWQNWQNCSWPQWDPQAYASMNDIWSLASPYPTYVPSNAFSVAPDVTLTSVMMRNIPNNYTRAMLLELLAREGFGSTFDFLYLPIDLKKRSGLGYAFINFICQDIAEHFCQHFSGFRRWAATSQKICQVTWSDYIQGFHAHVERYRNSAIMHESVPEDCKPMIFQNGLQLPFPAPTKAIPEPQERQISLSKKANQRQVETTFDVHTELANE